MLSVVDNSQYGEGAVVAAISSSFSRFTVVLEGGEAGRSRLSLFLASQIRFPAIFFVSLIFSSPKNALIAVADVLIPRSRREARLRSELIRGRTEPSSSVSSKIAQREGFVDSCS